MSRRILFILMIVSLSVVFYVLVARPLLAPVVELPQLPGVTLIFTLVLWLFSFCHAIYMLGWRQALIFFLLSVVVSWLYEQIGVATGLIYGPYHYTDRIGLKLGHVPLLIPIAWFMMLYPCYVIANLVGTGRPAGVGGSLGRIVWLSALGAMSITAWDLAMDPGSSSPPNQSWIWEQGGPYFGVPIQNFTGWLLTTFTVYMLYRLVERQIGVRPLAPVTKAVVALPLVAYFSVMVNYILPMGNMTTETLGVIALFAMGFPLLAATGRLLVR